MRIHSIDSMAFNPFTPSLQMQNLTGRQFGRLRVISLYARKKRNIYWLCRCTCKNWGLVSGGNLLSGTASCGCGVIDAIKRSNSTHGSTDTPEYRAYSGAKNRCVSPSHNAYKWYGGRGIEFRFNSFEEFYAEVGPRPEGLTLDRIDNDGHYEKGNVRWANRLDQTHNRRCAVELKFNGVSQGLVAWAEHTGINQGTLRSRLYQGWPVEKILTYPVDYRKASKSRKF